MKKHVRLENKKRKTAALANMIKINENDKKSSKNPDDKIFEKEVVRIE